MLTLSDALGALTPTLDKIRAAMASPKWDAASPEAREPFTAITDAVETLAKGSPAARGTVKAWMTAHHGQRVHTVQCDRDGRNPWVPTARLVDATSKASSVILSSSQREYAGCRVVAATDDMLVMSTKYQVAMYVVAA